MIKRLQYKEIDFQRYAKCLENSLQTNIYAPKEILDALCDTWELLVYNEYEYVMPVPVRKKFGFRVVIMPLFCQQLGVFGPEINETIELKFLAFLKENYQILTYHFNFQNLATQGLKPKKNYLIDKTEYSLLRKNYFKGRKSAVKSAQDLYFKEVNRTGLLSFIRAHFRGLDKKSDLEKFFTYLKFLEDRHQLKIFGAYKEDHLTNLALVIATENRYSLLGLVNDDQFKTDNGASFLIDRILQENIHARSFDFMGGNMRGIEVFFKSFGAELREYPILEFSKKELVKNFLQK